MAKKRNDGGPAALSSLRLRNFKGFESFDLNFRPFTLLVGPNNAGKSTLLSAIRAGASMLALASRRNATANEDFRGETVRVHYLGSAPGGLETENLRHEFQDDVETSLEFVFGGQSRLRAVWPEQDSGRSPFFFVRMGGVGQPHDFHRVKSAYGSIGAIPILRPVDQRERVLDDKYVRANLSGRLASSHFRNQVRLLTLEGNFELFRDFAFAWLPEISIEPPRASGADLDMFYREGGSLREIVWAGDGFQIFMQLLLHIWRQRDQRTIVLDEPEVFLHADLQRRLLSLLESLEAQVIFATHSSEIIASSTARSIVWVDRGSKKGIVAPDDNLLEDISSVLGSRFNLRIARLLRTRAAVFVEGGDLELLRPIAIKLGFKQWETEVDLAIVPLEGSGNWQKLVSFEWLAKNFLKGSLRGFAIFDRDFSFPTIVAERQSVLAAAGVHAHTWRRHEIESYLLIPSVIARISGATEDWVKVELEPIAESLRPECLARIVSTRASEMGLRNADISRFVLAASKELDDVWQERSERLWKIPAKEVLSR